ncbi:type II toxin-antitoxin system PemK/MazF family toxin [Frigoriflavimonas asaccharolytica]|uniref:mRNA interferase n=1 Tax=Frigoriflavimonas asaccharolytica TaxID=2735899 RepID=A0A8J8K8U7_9FLAO|nr:type II toxin-antitoxin system PemK/MazF family toxin [Frigoriflavimonas asaccharolytica]NRS92941.1 mRNA interferase MazF [Frigoriflavimonas asaccharolytica]
MELIQYSIVLVNLDPAIGSEIQKTRPCVIVSPNEMNRHLKTIVIVPMTTNLNKYPSRIPVNHNDKKGMIAIDQIKTVDKKRILKVLGILSKREITMLKDILKETFVD